MPCKMARSPSDRKVFVGDLARDVRRKELEDICSEYGRVRDCWVARNPPGFAFIEFDDARDAADTVRQLNGRRICGRRVHAKLYTEKMNNRGRSANADDKCYECRSTGHFARECRYRHRRPQRRDHRSSSRDRSRSPSHSRRRRHTRSRSDDRDTHQSRASPDRYRRRQSPPPPSRRRTPSRSPRISRSRYSDRRSSPSPAERRPIRPRSPEERDTRRPRSPRSTSRSSSRGRRLRRHSESPHNDERRHSPAPTGAGGWA